MGSPPFTADTEQRIDALFPAEKRALVRKLLLEECGHNLPFSNKSDSAAMDRCRFAALKVSGGDRQKLQSAVRLAKTGWRDLLVAAGFANDPQAQLRWTP